MSLIVLLYILTDRYEFVLFSSCYVLVMCTSYVHFSCFFLYVQHCVYDFMANKCKNSSVMQKNAHVVTEQNSIKIQSE